MTTLEALTRLFKSKGLPSPRALAEEALITLQTDVRCPHYRDENCALISDHLGLTIRQVEEGLERTRSRLDDVETLLASR